MNGFAFFLAALSICVSEIEPLPGEKWWGGAQRAGEKSDLPYTTTAKQVDLARSYGGTTSPFFVSTAGRYVWSDRPFAYSFSNGVLRVESVCGRVEPVVAGKTLKEAYLAACRKHFPFNGKIPAELLFTKPMWNNWIEIAINGMRQDVVDRYTDELAESGFPCGVYIMDGGWMKYHGSYEPHPEYFPDMKAMFQKVHDHGWKAMIWTAYFLSPDSRKQKRLRYGPGYNKSEDGRDLLVYRRSMAGRELPLSSKMAGVFWWWSGTSTAWDLTYAPARDDYLRELKSFAMKYGIDGFKFDAGDPEPLMDVRFHDPAKEPVDFAHEYVRLGAENFEYCEFRSGFRTGGMPVMQRLHDQGHTWKALSRINACMLDESMIGSPYVVADMVGGGLAGSYRPGGFFSEKLFLRFCAQQALHPMMQFSAAPWRYLSAKGCEEAKAFANLHVEFGPYILELARHAAATGEPIARPMEYEFPHQGFESESTQYMLGPKWLVANVVREDDSVAVRLPAGRWRDDLGELHEGPKAFVIENVPTGRLPRFEKLGL